MAPKPSSERFAAMVHFKPILADAALQVLEIEAPKPVFQIKLVPPNHSIQ
jgi:hypothetical protein